MRMSTLFSKTLREAPIGADSKGYEYLLRAGFIHQLGTGVFNLLPLGFRSIQKIEAIIRDEMNKIGGQEILMPLVNPADVWKETGRYYLIDREMSRFEDRHGRPMVLAMTHEEVATDLARSQIDSYKRLPGLVYQIQTKWRDDPRPRAGLIRVREFTMKDSYSFDLDQAGLEKQYHAHYTAYFRIFGRTGLPVIVVGADSGMMGGSISHEYMYLSPIGEDTIITCSGCSYTANRQVALFKKTYYPSEAAAIEKVHSPDCKTIEELVALLDIEERETAKAVFLVGTFIDAESKEETEKLIVGIIRGDLEVEENKLQKAAGANALRPAHPEEIAAQGIVPGYGSPIGASEEIMVIVDDSAAKSNNLVAGANEEGYHLRNTNFGRDYQGTIADIASAQAGYACAHCDGTLHSSKGIEVGNIFQLGTFYSENMHCYYQDENGKRKPVIMGSYGIGVGRLLASLAEHYHDDAGMALPITVAPMQVHLVSLVKDTAVVEGIYKDLTAAGIEVLYDDRKESAGVKFSDADLIGLPIRLTVGNRSLKEGKVEVKVRSDLSEQLSFDLETVVSETQKLIASMVEAIDDAIVEEVWDGN